MPHRRAPGAELTGLAPAGPSCFAGSGELEGHLDLLEGGIERVGLDVPGLGETAAGGEPPRCHLVLTYLENQPRDPGLVPSPVQHGVEQAVGDSGGPTPETRGDVDGDHPSVPRAIPVPGHRADPAAVSGLGHPLGGAPPLDAPRGPGPPLVSGEAHGIFIAFAECDRRVLERLQSQVANLLPLVGSHRPDAYVHAPILGYGWPRRIALFAAQVATLAA